ncbi:unnamed protein product [Closterium sp. NIES-53]
MYDAVVARYSSLATAALGRLILPYLFSELSAFSTVEDLITHLRTSNTGYRTALPAEFLYQNPPPMYITLYFIVTHLLDSFRAVRDHFLALDPTYLTIDLLENHLLAPENSIVAVGAARGTPRTPFFEGCSPSPLAPSYASAAAVDILDTEDVGAAFALSGNRRSGKGKGGKSRGGGSGGGGGGGGGGGRGDGGGDGSGSGSGGFGDGSGGSGGSGGGGGGGSGSGGGGSGGGRGGVVQRGGYDGDHSGQTCGNFHTQHYFFSRLDIAWRAEFGDEAERPRWLELLRSGVDIFALDYDSILAAMYALSVSAEGDCYLCVPPDPAIEAAALGASESSLPGTAPAEALHTFTFDSGASRCFFRDSTTLTPLPAPVPIRLADPLGDPVLARSSSVLPFPAVPSGSLSSLHLPSFSMNLVSTVALQDAMVTTTTPGGQCVSICTCTRTGCHLATFTRRPRGQDRERYFLLVVDDYTRYTTVFPLRTKGEDLLVLRLHSDRGGEFSSNLLRDFCRGEGILQSFTLPASPQQNGVAECRIGLVMEVARTSMIHAAAPQFLWPFAVRYAAHQLNLWPWVSLPETSPTVRWIGKVGDASVFRFYHPTLRRVQPSQDVMFDESIPFYRLFPYRTAPLPPPPAALPRSRSPTGRPPPPLGSCSLRAWGAESEGAESGGAEPEGAEPGDAELEGAEPGGAESKGAESGGAEPRGTTSAGGPAAARAGVPAAGGTGAGGAGATCPGGAGDLARAGDPGGTGAAGPGGARTRGTRAAEAGGVGDPGAGGTGAGDRGAGCTGIGGARSGGARAGGAGAGGPRDEGAGARAGDPGVGGAGAGGAGACGIGAGGTLQRLLFFVLPPPSSLSPPNSDLRHVFKRHEPASCPASPVRSVRTSRCVPRPRPPPVLGTHIMALRSSSVPLRVPLPSPPASSLAEGPDPESDLVRAASPTLPRLLATVVTDPLFNSAAASALVAELVDFAAACRLDYAASLVAESKSDCPPSVGGKCALGTDVLEERQEDFECLGATVPHLMDMLLAPEGDPDAPDIPTPRSFAEAITGPYSSKWVKPPPGSPPVFKALYVLQRFGFRYSLPQSTPLPTGHSLSAPPSVESVEPSGPYPELVGCLMYLMTFTRPDLAYPLSILARYVAPGRHRPEHWEAVKRLLHYLCSTSGMGLVLGGRGPAFLTGHADASWVEDLTTQRSSQLYTLSLGSGSISWRSTRSSSVLSFSCEAEIYTRAMDA